MLVNIPSTTPSPVEIVLSYFNRVKTTRKESTSKIYEWHLMAYFKYLHSIKKNLHRTTSEDIRSYLESRPDWSASVKNHFITIVKSFYKYYINKIPAGIDNNGLRFKLNRENAVREILMFPYYKKPGTITKKSLTLSELKELLITAKEYSYDDYCFIYVMFYFGLRKSELRKMKIPKNINWHENKIIITADISKSGIDRVLYFDNNTKNILKTLHEKYGDADKFVSISDNFLNRMFMRYDCILECHLHPHMARHTFNTEMIKSIKGRVNVDEVIAVKMLMGHGGDMTQRYSHYEPELKQIMLKYHYMYGSGN